MVKVKLAGLKIARSRGKYYVYVRSTGEALVKGFDGDKAALVKKLAEPGFIGAYNARRGARTYPKQTLGWLAAWYQSSDCAEYTSLAPSTRENYDAALLYLEPEYDAPLDTITPAAVYGVRDKCAVAKWPAFADNVTTTLSSMFNAAVKRGMMPSNPAKGIERARKSDPNANREWQPSEWAIVMERAPAHLRTAYMIARHLGYRSQSVVAVTWKNYQPDPRFRMCFRMAHRKNGERHWLPASPLLQDYLASLKVRTKDGKIALRFNGQPWESEEQLQKQSSNFLAKLTKNGMVEPGLTLHGLRVSFAAEIKRVTGASDAQIARALGDRDDRMGGHYTRHVEQENQVALAFFSLMSTGTEQDLENGRMQVFQNSENTSKVIDLKE